MFSGKKWKKKRCARSLLFGQRIECLDGEVLGHHTKVNFHMHRHYEQSQCHNHDQSAQISNAVETELYSAISVSFEYQIMNERLTDDLTIIIASCWNEFDITSNVSLRKESHENEWLINEKWVLWFLSTLTQQIHVVFLYEQKTSAGVDNNAAELTDQYLLQIWCNKYINVSVNQSISPFNRPLCMIREDVFREVLWVLDKERQQICQTSGSMDRMRWSAA